MIAKEGAKTSEFLIREGLQRGRVTHRLAIGQGAGDGALRDPGLARTRGCHDHHVRVQARGHRRLLKWIGDERQTSGLAEP